MPSDPSNLIGWHHLQGHRFRKLRSPDWRRRGDRFYGLELVIRVICSAGTLLIDQSDGSLMGDPPTVQMSVSHPSLSEVLVVLPENPGNLLLEASELIPKIFKFVLYDGLTSVLLSEHLLQIIGLEEPLSDLSYKSRHCQKGTLVFSSRSIHLSGIWVILTFFKPMF